MCTFSAAEEHVEAKLGDVLELALSRRVVERHERIVDESEERVAVILIVSNRRRCEVGCAAAAPFRSWRLHGDGTEEVAFAERDAVVTENGVGVCAVEEEVR